jgi:DNA mismatch repair protein MutS2
MDLQPRDLYHTLEFDKVIELIARECMGELGIAEVEAIAPTSDSTTIDRLLREVKELKLSIHKNDKFPVYKYFEINQELKMLAIEGYVIPVEGLQKINSVLVFIRDIYRFFNAARREVYPNLYNIIRPIVFDEDLLKAINRVIDDEGKIRPDASPELARIRRSINARQKDLDKEFRAIISQLRSKGWLTDNEESFRNGRRVLSVPSEHKRKIRGIIHDESATGRTTFIEPEGVIEINNDIFDLEQEERREIYKILKALSEILRPYTPRLLDYQTLATRFDVIQAKARVAILMNASMPIVKDHPRFGILKGYHPLLWLKNQGTEKKTIPFDLWLLRENRVLVISGPNAGGKSVTMKAAGLLQLMLQCGLLVPVSELSEMGIFDSIFADIGDQQSLEDDLSTYSSRLKNMRTFLDKATPNTLILIDEFGSGTDPVIGGAIAEAILKELNERNVFGVITTHYSNLKVFAFQTKGLVNGCMVFDKEHLRPTYEMQIGRPGSSYAFEIAEKSGLGKKVLSHARHRTGKNEKAVDELLVDLQREKKETEDLLTELRDKQRNLDKLIKNYDELHKELDFRRKKHKLDVKEVELQGIAKENRDLERLIRELREEKNLEKAKELAAQTRAAREKIVEKVDELNEDLYKQTITRKDIEKGAIKVGDMVKMTRGGTSGLVESINKAKAVIRSGFITITVNLSELQHAAEGITIQREKSVNVDVVRNTANFESKLDLRGMRMLDAIQVLERFLDDAMMTSSGTIAIVHGKGDGILRQAVKKTLKTYKSIHSVRSAEKNDGGDGVTLAEL